MKKLQVALLLTTVLLSVPALAADQVPGVEAVDQGRWGFTVGGFAGFAPTYEGSDEYRFVGFPLIIPKYYGDNYDPLAAPRVTFKGIDDVRITALRFGQIDIGPLVGYTFGRDEDDADRLDGLGDIDGGVTAGAFTALRLEPFYIDLAYVRQVTGDDDSGHTIRLGAGWEDQLSERVTGRAYLSTAYASDEYMATHFGVTSGQSASSGLSAYEAEAGLKNVSLDFGVDYKLTERWTVSSNLGYSHLLGDAADSPITASESQFSGGMGLTYTFGRTD